MRKIFFQGIATLCFLAACAIELGGSGRPWPGFGENSLFLPYTLAAFWLAAVLGLWTKRGFSNFSLVLGTFLVLADGLWVSLGVGLGGGEDRSLALALTGLAMIAGASTLYARYPSLWRAGEREELALKSAA